MSDFKEKVHVCKSSNTVSLDVSAAQLPGDLTQGAIVVGVRVDNPTPLMAAEGPTAQSVDAQGRLRVTGPNTGGGGGAGWQHASLDFTGGVMADVTSSIDLSGFESFAFPTKMSENDPTSALALEGWDGTTQDSNGADVWIPVVDFRAHKAEDACVIRGNASSIGLHYVRFQAKGALLSTLTLKAGLIFYSRK